MRRSIHRALVAAAVLAALGTAGTSARAQGAFAPYAFQPRLFVGVGLGYNYLFNNSLYFCAEGAVCDPRVGTHPGSQSGFDWSLFAGLRFSEWVSAEIGWDAFYHPSAESAEYNYAVIDGIRATGRIYFPTGYNLFPFLRLGIGYYFYGDEFEVDTHGVGFQGGIGATYQFHEMLEMDFTLLYQAWYFEGIEDPTSSSPIDCESGRFCPFGDDYMHSVNLQLEFRWNSWMFAW
jgi:hypothetical protein